MRYPLLRHIPNAITFARIAALPVLIWMSFVDARQPFAYLMIACLVGDILDGLLARMLKVTSEFGAKLDSLADALLLLVSAWGAWVFHEAAMREHAVAFALVPGMFVAENIAALLRYGQLSSFHTLLSRVAAYALGIFIGILFLVGYVVWLADLAVGLLVVATLEEFILLRMFPHWTANVGGVIRVLRQRRAAKP